MTHAQLSDAAWEFIGPFLPIGLFGPYPARLRAQFEGVVWRFRTGSPWRELPAEFGRGRRCTTGFGSGGTTGCSTRCSRACWRRPPVAGRSTCRWSVWIPRPCGRITTRRGCA
ncbi:transposase [Frankia sp. AgB32]|uniref:transposase n=1 Tax=Frankia sp. AgB32 TaxID=631119 RepID=UPI0034D505FB